MAQGTAATVINLNNRPENKIIRIVEYFDCYDLRSVTAQSDFLRQHMNTYKLKHMDAILFTNAVETRFRLILNLHGLPLLCTPEIDERTNYSLYLKISETMEQLSGVRRVEVGLRNLRLSIKAKEEKHDAKQHEATKTD